MSENPPIVTLPPDQMIAWYRHRVQVLQGYALALALRAGLSPEEAATVFIDPLARCLRVVALLSHAASARTASRTSRGNPGRSPTAWKTFASISRRKPG